MTISFADAVVLTRDEVFDALETCAIGEAALRLGADRPAARRLAELFELLEDRVTIRPTDRPPAADQEPGVSVTAGAPLSAGSNSSDRELTQ